MAKELSMTIMIRGESMSSFLKRINPIARLLAYTRKRKQVVPPKKGKGSYNRNNKHKQKERLL
jgi:stalled ribosome alternative rescue factor ArfA